MYYGNDLDRYLTAEAAHEAAKKELSGQVPELVRLYLIAVQSQLASLQHEVAQAIANMSKPGDPMDVDSSFVEAARAAVPSLDDVLHGDSLSGFVADELAARTLHEYDAINEVAIELMGKVFSI